MKTKTQVRPTIQIRNLWNDTIIFEGHFDSMKECVLAAIRSNCDLSGCDLSGSNLSNSDLTPIRDDIWAVLSSAPKEAIALREALETGRVNGSTYSGSCACLVGTLAIARGTDEHGIPGLAPNAARPAERFFMSIKTGDIPQTSQTSMLAHGWVCEWIDRMQAAFGAKP
jgi:hypothetical protein